jgi:predicted ATPase
VGKVLKTKSKWYVLTGGPSSGKTTLLEELRRRGYNTVQESSRQYIEDRLAQGYSLKEIRNDEKKFQEEVLKKMHALHKTLDKNAVTFFDRGYHDATAYLKYYNHPLEKFVEEIGKQANYAKVFVLDLLPYKKDEARIEDPKIAEGLHQSLINTYKNSGHEVIKVPVMPVNDRTDFVLKHVELSS